MNWTKNLRRIALTLILAATSGFISGVPAFGTPELTVSAPTSIEYDPAVSGFSVTGFSISNPPAYLQVGLTLVDTQGTQTPASDLYRIAVGDQCPLDASWINNSTNGTVTISGDNSTNVIMSGAEPDITDLLSHVWVYTQNSPFCSRGTDLSFGQSLLNRKLKVTAIESAPGLFWSPSTKHYYQLATQTTSDGMGQPTDDNGNITDASRYFVRWSTARANAKSASITIGGQTHVGYLAAITTKDEFSFLNDNVTGGSGVLYPAWVGGSDGGVEGNWRWVDGPEAKRFGGDSLFQVNQYDPEGRIFNPDGPYIEMNGSYSWETSGLLMRDQSGDVVKDLATGYNLVVNLYNGTYCTDTWNDIETAWANYSANGPEIESTPYGSTVKCKIEFDGYYLTMVPVVVDANNREYGSQNNLVYRIEPGYNYSLTANGDYLAVRPFTTDMNYSTTNDPSYAGAFFWGNDSQTPPGTGTPDYCTQRGVRGYCNMGQFDIDGNWTSSNYFVYWSNGSGYNVRNWDGTGAKPGDGVYSPQPDNASNEDALIINWCQRNNGGGAGSTAPTQSLYGNSGYRCTPGWNDLPAGNWSTAHQTYSSAGYDTPNQIGTTDYVVEYCGYTDEASCEVTPTANVATAFTVASSSCPASGTPQLNVSYAGPNIDATDLSSPTMNTETFDSVPAGGVTDQMTNVGYMSGSAAVGGAGIYGGAGGTGSYMNPIDELLTLPTTECYLGFWWSAGNPGNTVDLLDGDNNVLASFNSADLVTALGACPNPYCGNPNLNYGNGGELYAYVHMRLPTGFQKVRFYGYGFELDNISVSIEVPDRSNNETNLNGPATLTLVTPDVVPVDPSATAVTLPEFQVSGDSTASLCLLQVADSAGNTLDSTSLTYTVPETDPVTLQPVGAFLVLSGVLADVITSSGHLVIAKNDSSPVASTQSTFLRVYAVAGQNPDATACSGGASKIIEIRPIGIDLTQIFDIQITDHSN